MTLEDLLMLLGYKRPFNKNGRLSKYGNNAYNKLLDIIYGVAYLVNMDTKSVNEIVTELDKIEWEN